MWWNMWPATLYRPMLINILDLLIICTAGGMDNTGIGWEFFGQEKWSEPPVKRREAVSIVEASEAWERASCAPGRGLIIENTWWNHQQSLVLERTVTCCNLNRRVPPHKCHSDPRDPRKHVPGPEYNFVTTSDLVVYFKSRSRTLRHWSPHREWMNCPYWQAADGGGGQWGVAGRLVTIVMKSVTQRTSVEIILDPELRTLGVHHSRVAQRLCFWQLSSEIKSTGRSF